MSAVFPFVDFNHALLYRKMINGTDESGKENAAYPSYPYLPTVAVKNGIDWEHSIGIHVLRFRAWQI